MSALASFSNWQVMNQPCDLATDHADTALSGRSDDDLGAVEAHKLAPLDTEGLSHGDRQRITFGRTDHRQADAGVAGGRLDHCLTGFNSPDFSAASMMMPSARRSFTEPSGLKASILT
jgi:hypothetical protein